MNKKEVEIVNAKAVRNSNIEFVRIISIFVIVLSHIVGVGGVTCRE